MSRLLTCGFEVGYGLTIGNTVVGEDASFATTTGDATFSSETTIVRSGARSLKFVGTSSQSAQITYNLSGIVTSRIYYVRMCIYASTLPSLTWWPSSFASASAGVELQVDGTAMMLATSSGNANVLGSTTYTLATGQWYVVEYAYIPAGGTLPGGTTNQNAQLRVNGASIGYGTCETSTPTMLTIQCSAVGTVYFDDWALNDNQGSANNAWCGDTNKIVLLKPTADASAGSFVPGHAGDNLYNCVDHAPPTGTVQTDTTTVNSKIKTNTASDAYQATMQTYDAAGVTGTVQVVQGIVSHANSTTSASSDGVTVVSNPAGSEALANTGTTAGATWPTGWTTMKTAALEAPSVTTSSAPVVQFHRNNANGYSMADLIGLYVEYTPSAGPTASVPDTVAITAAVTVSPTGGPPTANVPDTVAAAETVAVQVTTPSIVVGDLEYDDSANASHTGGAISTALTSGQANNVWADVSSADCTTGKTYYACVYVKNKNATVTWQGVQIWIDGAPAQGSAAIGLDSAAAGATAASSCAGNDPTVAPSPAITFTSPTDRASGIGPVDIPGNSYKAVWIRRTIPAGATADPSAAISIRAEGGTP